MADYLEGMDKEAAEEDAAGRIMARGFMDELNKLAAKPKASKAVGTKQSVDSNKSEDGGEKVEEAKEEALPGENSGWSESQG